MPVCVRAPVMVQMVAGGSKLALSDTHVGPPSLTVRAELLKGKWTACLRRLISPHQTINYCQSIAYQYIETELWRHLARCLCHAHKNTLFQSGAAGRMFLGQKPNWRPLIGKADFWKRTNGNRWQIQYVTNLSLLSWKKKSSRREKSNTIDLQILVTNENKNEYHQIKVFRQNIVKTSYCFFLILKLAIKPEEWTAQISF